MANTEMGSVFAQLRANREKIEGKLNESYQEPIGTIIGGTTNLNESTEDGTAVGETFKVIQCHDCKAIISALDECECGCPVCGSDDLDEKTVTVVKNGKVEKKNVSSHKKKLSAAQKAALAKARKKAHSAGANKARAKSMKVRAKKGLDEAKEMSCPACGYTADEDEFIGNGGWECPECGNEWGD